MHRIFDEAPPIHLHTLSLHDALPISCVGAARGSFALARCLSEGAAAGARAAALCGFGSSEASPSPSVAEEKTPSGRLSLPPDRKSTRLNASHPSTSYAVFCWKRKTTP